MLRTQTEAWPSVMGLSPVSGDLLPLSPTWHKKHRLLAVRETLVAFWALGCRSGTDDMSQLSLDDNIKPASSHPLPVLHMPFLSFTAYFKRYNTLASCPCF